MSQDFTGIPGTEKQTRTERSYGCPGPPGWSKFTGPYPLDLISTVLAAWHQKSVLQVCRDLEKSRSQSMAVSDVGQLERWVQEQVCAHPIDWGIALTKLGNEVGGYIEVTHN